MDRTTVRREVTLNTRRTILLMRLLLGLAVGLLLLLVLECFPRSCVFGWRDVAASLWIRIDLLMNQLSRQRLLVQLFFLMNRARYATWLLKLSMRRLLV